MPLKKAKSYHLGAYTLTARNQNGNASPVNSNTVFDLSSTRSGAFYSDAAGTTPLNPAQVTISNGQSAATFYYRDTAYGTPTLTATHNSGMALGNGSLEIQVSGNKALKFDGVNDYVAADGVCATLDNPARLSLEAWINPADFSNQPYFLAFNNGDKTNNIQLGVQSDGTLKIMRDGTVVSGSTVLTLNRWYHVALTLAYNSAVLYLNGVSEITTTITQRPPSNGYFSIGQEWNGGGATDFFNGFIDEVRVWNTDRTQAQIRANMHRQLQGDDTGLAAYYKMDTGTGSTAKDSSASGTDGTLTGDPSWRNSGAFAGPRNALTFDGSDAYVATAAGPDLATGKAFTMECWAKRSGTGRGVMLGQGETNSGLKSVYFGFTRNDNLYVGYISGYLPSSDAYTDTDWHHYAFTYDNRSVKGYRDGIEVLSGTFPGDYAPENNRISIAVGPFNLSSYPFAGRIDEVRVWDTVRTPAQIRDNMCKSMNGDESGLVSYYRMDQQAVAGQSTLYDQTPNGNNGTLTNMDPAADWGASAAFNTWIGSESTDWAAGSNWSRYAQPAASDNIGIVDYPDPAYAPTIGAAAEGNHLVIGSDATLTLGSNTLTLGGHWIRNGTADIGSGTVGFDGTVTSRVLGQTTFNNMTVNKSQNGVTLDDNCGVDGTLELTDGELNNASATLTLGNGATINRSGGTLSNVPTFTTSVDVVYSGGTILTTGPELPAAASVLNDLTINDSGNVILGANAGVNHELALTTGLFYLGDYDFTIGQTAVISGSPTAANMIVTNGTGVLKKMFGGTGSFTFPVGNNGLAPGETVLSVSNGASGQYTPATLNFTSGTFGSGAWAGVNVTNSKQPDNDSATNYLNRYWRVTQEGISSFTCETTFNYVTDDVAGSEASIYGAQWNGTGWTLFDPVNTATHAFEAEVSSFSDFTGVGWDAPGDQASGITFSSVAETGMTVNWTRGGGDNVLVVAHQGSAVDGNPVNGTAYTAGAVFGAGTEIGTGNYVVYKGTGTSVAVSGLTASTDYYFRAYEYDDTDFGASYNTTTAAGNPNHWMTLPDVPVATAATGIGTTGFTANWNAVTVATGYRLDVATDSAFTQILSDYNNKDVGNLTSSEVTGLSSRTKYYYRIRAYNTGGTSGNSNRITAATLPEAPTATAATSLTRSGFTANWSATARGSGYYLDVALDSEFTRYVSGYQNKDVGNVTSHAVTDLSEATDYFYRVRAYEDAAKSADSNTIRATTLDGTGVSPEIQDAAPNDGDGNGDGIKDRLQPTVASLPSAAAGAGYLTLAITGCDQLESVKASTYGSVGVEDPGFNYPFGLVAFNIPCGSATIRIYYHGATTLAGYVYRKYGPTPSDWLTSIWYSMPNPIFGTSVIGGSTVPWVEFPLTEAQLGDDTPVYPIVDQGGVATGQAPIPTLNEWGILLLALLLGGGTFWRMRRRRTWQ